jgi:hypothetical protein
MTPEFDYRIADWLEDDPDMAPSIVLETVVGALPSIPQRRSWRFLPRFYPMPRLSIAATLLLVAAVGLSAWIAGSRGGMGGVPTTPLPTVVPTQAPASPRALGGIDQGSNLTAGGYRVVNPFESPFGFSLHGENWQLQVLEHNIAWFDRSDGARGIGFLGVFRPNNVYLDACHSKSGPVPADTVEDFAAALAALPGYTVGPITDVAIGGALGKSLTIENSIDVEAEGCSDASVKLATYDRFGTDVPIFGATGDPEQILLLDVNGEVVLVQTVALDNATAAELAETEQTIKSIDFD